MNPTAMIAKFHKPGSVKYFKFSLVLYIFYIKNEKKPIDSNDAMRMTSKLSQLP